MDVYVESGVGAHVDNATLAWVFDIEHWGRCGYGTDEESALSDLAQRLVRADTTALRVVERISGNEQAFARDRLAATDAERTATLDILTDVRAETIELVAAATDDELDFDDPARMLPAWATWRTPRQLAGHIADCGSHYYLARLGVAAPEPADDLLAELRRSAEHVCAAVASMPSDAVREAGSEVWTTVKVLRRLAWHERDELDVLRGLLARARRCSGGT